MNGDAVQLNARHDQWTRPWLWVLSLAQFQTAITRRVWNTIISIDPYLAHNEGRMNPNKISNLHISRTEQHSSTFPCPDHICLCLYLCPCLASLALSLHYKQAPSMYAQVIEVSKLQHTATIVILIEKQLTPSINTGNATLC